ncbi:ABC transporter ATP-binding protein [Vibrio sp. 10N.222.46.A1]|uniref:ABC transporter ATP-binding protein n=1 Tax=Vibrio sp. 10N.222.46.A1 TaxID=3229599 RepID=UPI0035547010
MNKRQFVAHYLRMNRPSYLLAIVFIFLVNWLQVEIPRYIQLAIDLIEDASTTGHQQLQTYVWIVVGMSVAMVVVRILSRIYALNPGRITEAALKSTLLQKLNRLPSSFHERFASGRLISIMNNDLSGIRLMFGVGFLQFFNALLALSLTPLYMWRISPELTLYSIIPISIAFVIFRVGFKRMKTLHLEHMKRLQNLSAQLMSYLSGIDLIKSQQMSPWVKAETEKLNQLLLECRLIITRIQVFFMPVLDYANDLMKIIILGLGGYMLMRQELTLGEITAFLTYSVLLAMPLMQLGRIATIYQRGMVGIQSVQTILNAKVPDLDEDKLTELDVESLKGKTFSIRNLSFSYSGEERLILDDISFDIPAGKKVALVGASGGGKSTLIQLLIGVYQADSGCIRYNGETTDDISFDVIRSQIAVVLQQPILFNDTLRHNLTLGAEYDEMSLWRALEVSQMQDVIKQLSNGLDTQIGRNGVRLSGGQRQRLAIARMVLSNPKFVILDEATSALDTATESALHKALSEFLKDRTTLIVAHRLSAVKQADLIYVLEDGQVTQTGTHGELVEQQGLYQTLYGSVQSHA